MTLMLFRTLSSSTFALTRTLQGVERRLHALLSANNDKVIADEYGSIKAMLDLCESITENAKGCELLTALKKGFSELKRLGAKRKSIIFTEYRETQKYLYDLLNAGEYKDKVLTFSGEQSRDYSIIERLEKAADILVTTDIAAEGFNLEFCSFVINYDLPYNTLKIEQRISRCHRHGQHSDVLVVNFLNRNNFADVRMLELINKRILQYDGIIGLSDDVIGNLNVNVSKDFNALLAAARTKDEIEKAFDEILAEYEKENKQLVKTAEQSLFTIFKKEIADNVTVSPQYIEQRIQEVNAELWTLTRHFFEEYNDNHSDNRYEIDEQAQTVTATGELSTLFYYWTGSRNKPYQSLCRYGMDKKFKPASGRITLSSVIGRGVLQQAACADSGTLTVDADIEPCTIGLYCIYVKLKENDGTEYVTLLGMTVSGRTLTNEECCDIMGFPIVSFTEDGKRTERWLRESTGSGVPHELDSLISKDEYICRAISETDSAVKEEIEHLRALTQDSKIELERGIEMLRSEVGALTCGLERTSSIAEKVKAEKRKAAAQKELKQREQQLFIEGMRLDVELDEKIKRLKDAARYTASIRRQFVINVEGHRT